MSVFPLICCHHHYGMNRKFAGYILVFAAERVCEDSEGEDIQTGGE